MFYHFHNRLEKRHNTVIAIDEELFMRFKNHDANYQDRINQLLRDYIENDLVK